MFVDRPHYAIIHTSFGKDRIRSVGRIIRRVHSELKSVILEGITTEELNSIAFDIIKQEGGSPAFLGYRGFPFSICASVNNTILHGFPDDTKLMKGDIVSIDVGVCKDNYYGDACFTTVVGESLKSIVSINEECLYTAIDMVRDGVKIANIGEAIDNIARRYNLNTLKNYSGHSIGMNLHEYPFIYNIKTNTHSILKTGMCICIEPMLTTSSNISIKNNWEVVGDKGSESSHIEHQIIVHENYGEIVC
jgi:methionyl aminopeptidase